MVSQDGRLWAPKLQKSKEEAGEGGAGNEKWKDSDTPSNWWFPLFANPQVASCPTYRTSK